MRYYWRFFCETLGFMIDDIWGSIKYCQEAIIVIWFGLGIVSMVFTMVYWMIVGSGKTPHAFLGWGMYFLAANGVGVFFYWIFTCGRRAKRRMR